jgi:hypothetical protein
VCKIERDQRTLNSIGIIINVILNSQLILIIINFYFFSSIIPYNFSNMITKRNLCNIFFSLFVTFLSVLKKTMIFFFYLCINTKALLFLFSFLIKPAFFFLFFFNFIIFSSVSSFIFLVSHRSCFF